MGKGTIVSHIGGGQYTVTLNRDRTRITRRLAVIAARMAELPGIILGHESARDAAEVEYNTAVNALNSIIAEMKLHPTEIKKYQEQIAAQTKVILEKEKIWRAWIVAVNNANLEYTSLTLEQGTLNGSDLADPTVTAWCVTKKTTMTAGTVVATAEVPYGAGLETYQIIPN